MNIASPTRLPLQVGSNSLWHVFRASLNLAPGLTLLAGSLFAAWGAGAWFFLAAFGAALVMMGSMHLRRAWESRASDVLLDRDGMRFEGGPHHGLRISWNEIDSSKTSCEEVREARLTVGALIFGLIAAWLSPSDGIEVTESLPIRRLRLVTSKGLVLALAVAEHPAEQASLDALFASIRARIDDDLGPEPEPSPRIFRCTGCRAGLAPADQPGILCPFCATDNKVPEALRARLRALASETKNRAESAALVRTLLEQPGARRASFVLAVGSVLSLLPWAFAATILSWLGLDAAGGFEVGWLLVFGGLSTLSIFLLARAALINRRALHLLAIDFAARAQGPGFVCRSCGAPFAPGESALLVRCAFCDADNLLGLDVVGRQRVSNEQKHTKHTLAHALEARRKERRRWLGLALLALVGGSLAGVMAATSYVMAREHALYQTKCAKGDANACHELAIDFLLGISVGENVEKAFLFDDKACRLGHPEACFDTSERYYYGWGTTENLGRADELRHTSCALGWQEACKER